MLDDDGLRFLLDSLPDAVLLCGETGSVLACNNQCEDLLGYRPDELVGLPVEVLIDPQTRQRHAGFRLAYMAAPRRRPMQQMQNICALRKDGSLHPVTIALGPALLDGRQLTIVSIRDNAAAVAARQRERAMYERLLRAQRLEDLGMLSCGIAHDFRNLLSIVLGNAELAMHELTEETISQRAYLQAIRTSAAHLQELSGHILSYAAGGETPRRPLDLNEAVAEMATLLQVSLPRTTTLSCEPASNLPDLLADPGHIAQILLNLILNAREAIGNRPGSIVVRTGRDCDQVFIEVEDDGCGIGEEVRDRVLDTFFTTKAGGKGLGLAVVKGIVEQYGGSTHIASSVGAGSIFRVLLPVTVSEPEPD